MPGFSARPLHTITTADDSGGILIDGAKTHDVTLLNRISTANVPICAGKSPTGLVAETISGISVANGAHDIAVHGHMIQANGDGGGGHFDIVNRGNGLYLNVRTASR